MKRKILCSIFLNCRVYIQLSLMSFFMVLSFPRAVPAESWQINKSIGEIGPLRIDDRNFVIILNRQKIAATAAAYNETVESFEIKDSQGKIYYRRRLTVSLGKNGFREEYGISAHTIKGENGQGLILYYSIEPSAPSSGRFCQILVLKQERLVPLSPPLTCYGKIAALPEDPSSHSVSLFAGDILKFNVWTGQYGIVIPLLVDWKKETIKPMVSKEEFDITAEKRFPQEGQIQLFSKPGSLSDSKQIKVKKNSDIEFVKAYAEVVMESFDSLLSEIHITIQNPWLKVRVDRNTGWINNWRDLNTIGLPSAG